MTMQIKVPLKVSSEGKVKILLPDNNVLGEDRARKIVFYNIHMAFSRDFSICVLKAYAKLSNKKLRIAEPLTASGIRGLRYAKEIEEVHEVLLSDVNPIAVELAEINAFLNRLEDKVIIKCSDANMILSMHATKDKRFDVVDIDPFGSPAPYIDSALRSTLIGGIIAVTATDMPPLCGVYPEVALKKYGGLSLKTEYCHEIAIRLVLGLLCREAGKYDLSIKPLIAHSTRHYIRVYAQLVSYKRTENIGFIYHCYKCLHRETVKIDEVSSCGLLCENCGTPMRLAGPLWIGPIFDKEFCREVLATLNSMTLPHKKPLRRTLSLIVSEADGPPTYYTIDSLSRIYKIRQPKMQDLIQKLQSEGFNASPTHFNPKGFRFNGKITELTRLLA
ncbi:MAG: tRNA (guanine(10)-N(2))-dimethyltransferase [Thermoprotei archaeon]|nr:MAG: tRNA (guanine(10)-N(2))-dimethyltransferase [Thermoprotei archaeon]